MCTCKVCTVQVKADQIEFEWDEGNLDKNYKKHGVTPEEVEEVFLDENLGIVPDIKHSGSEVRLIALGKTKNDRSLFVVFTNRKEKIRIVSVRRMHRKEVLKYERAKNNTKV